MCPIPTCKRYSPSAVVSSDVDVSLMFQPDPLDSEPAAVISSTSGPASHTPFGVYGSSTGHGATERIHGGVTYYPPRPDPPSYSTSVKIEEGSYSLLDVSVDKIIRLVEDEMKGMDLGDDLESAPRKDKDPVSNHEVSPSESSARRLGQHSSKTTGVSPPRQAAHLTTRSASRARGASLTGSHPRLLSQSPPKSKPNLSGTEGNVDYRGGTTEPTSVEMRRKASRGESSSTSRRGRWDADRATGDRSSSKRPRQHLEEVENSFNTFDKRDKSEASLEHIGEQKEWKFSKELMGILECDVCAMLLYDPVTTPCQHSFCSKCLSRSLDHSSRCPVCRQDLPSFAFFQNHFVNRVLLTVIRTAFPTEYADRQDAIERDERDARLDTPVFVCTLAFPGMPTILHVFEPRYRLMIRRCIESSSPRFGMVLPARGGPDSGMQGVMEYGTMLEIQSVQMLPDGRSMVETVGTHRFKLLEKGTLDGYTVGRIEKIEDISPEEEARLELLAVSQPHSAPPATSHSSQFSPSPQSSDPGQSATQISSTSNQIIPAPGHTSSTSPLMSSSPVNQPQPNQFHQPHPVMFPNQSMPPSFPAHGPEERDKTTHQYMLLCTGFIDQLKSGSAPWLLQRLNHTYGSMPDDPSEFSYWMALVMPIDEYEKARLLPIRSPRLRLKLIVHWVETLRSSWWFASG
ncbi:hypothetical protein M231_03777 [Tremella mesenterica]|uniref:RING-type domain-containing protein n=1 Tax=Tremella mesenterica TaxID=5217 RepID=A0A4Q1BMP4_TREME|nr:hypothetical protein M231_03777 [Tremella mesenterica]